MSARDSWVQLAAQRRAEGHTKADIARELRTRFGLRPLAALRHAHGWSQAQAAHEWNKLFTPLDDNKVKTAKDFSDLETDRYKPSLDAYDKLARLYTCDLTDLLADRPGYRRLDDAYERDGSQRSEIAEDGKRPLGGGDQLLARAHAPTLVARPAGIPDVDGIDAIELIRLSEASDFGSGTLTAIAGAVEGLASSYTHMVPADLLASLQTYRTYVMRLLHGRATLAQRRELMRQAGWLSLLVATAAIDVGYDRAAAANFDAAHSMARETGDDELEGWVFETEAWQALSAGRLVQAADLCRAGLEIAPVRTSAHVQLCTQAARASARMGDSHATRRLVDVSLTDVDRLPSPADPENHFVVDQQRVLLHCAAALVWLGERTTTAEEYARRAVREYQSGEYTHHLAVARMNLAILLAETDEPAEAAHLGQRAVTEAGWRLCHTDLFLAEDLHRSLTAYYDDTADIRDWTERYTETRRAIAARQPELTASTSAPPDAL